MLCSSQLAWALPISFYILAEYQELEKEIAVLGKIFLSCKARLFASMQNEVQVQVILAQSLTGIDEASAQLNS